MRLHSASTNPSLESTTEGVADLNLDAVGYTFVASRKVSLSWSEIRQILEQGRALCAVEPITIQTHERGLAWRLATA
jgi:hypothetical protein